MKETHEGYNEKLFEGLVSIYDSVGLILIPVRNKIVKVLEHSGSKKVLDVACGTGTQARALSEKGFKVTGIDLSKAMLERAKNKNKNAHRVNFIRGDATKMPFRDESFDVTIISFALHDMPENIRAKVLREMKRVTKMGGKILVADYAAPPDGLVPRVGHRISNLFESKYYASFMKAGLNKYLTQAGLKPRRRYALLMGIAQLAVCNK